jgi:hypothetical protein
MESADVVYGQPQTRLINTTLKMIAVNVFEIICKLGLRYAPAIFIAVRVNFFYKCEVALGLSG